MTARSDRVPIFPVAHCATRYVALDTLNPSTPCPSRANAACERLRIVAALQLLAPQQRAVVVLRYYEDLSLAHTAEALGIPPGTVKSTSARALERLAALLSEEPSEALE